MVKYSYIFLFAIIYSGMVLIIEAQTSQSLYLEKNFNTKKIIASVDSINITAEEFYLSYEYGPAFIKRIDNSKQRHVEYMINEKLLALDGYARHLDSTAEIKSMISEFEKDLAAEELYKKEILPGVNISEQEIEQIINKKQREIEIKWIYADNESEMKQLLPGIKTNFDSVFNSQFNDSVLLGDRYMITSIFQLENQNPVLARILDSLKAGDLSLPVHAEDGWYVVKLMNIRENKLSTQTEYQKLRQEAINFAMKKEMDSLSDKYVHQLMLNNNPVIKRDAFTLVRSYLAKFYLDKEKFHDWQLDQKLNQSLNSIGHDIANSMLVGMQGQTISIKDFLTWFRNRSEYIKLSESNIRDFSTSLERLIWRMVRDKLLSELAIKKGYDNSEEVKKQTKWWKDKIVGSAVRNEISGEVLIEQGEVNLPDSTNGAMSSEKLNYEFRKKMFHRIAQLKRKHKITFNKSELLQIPVSVENDKRAIEVYTVKTGGLIPRTPYPTINNEWVNWE